MIYNMMITEYLRKSVRVEADSLEEAVEQVRERLANEEVVLSADDFADRDIESVDDFNKKIFGHSENETNSLNYKVDLDFTEDDEIYVKDKEGNALIKRKEMVLHDDEVITRDEYYKYLGLQ